MEVMALSDRCVAAPSGGECFVGAGATSVRTLCYRYHLVVAISTAMV